MSKEEMRITANNILNYNGYEGYRFKKATPKYILNNFINDVKKYYAEYTFSYENVAEIIKKYQEYITNRKVRR